MKKLILSLTIVCFGILSANAQDGERIFKRFKGDVSLGYATPVGGDGNGGILFAMEPKFALMDKLSVGLRIEGAVMARFTGSSVTGGADIDNAKAAASYVATADYYFTNNYTFRPFVGAGAGVFGTASENSGSYNDDGSVRFGGIIRAGGEVKHFRFGVEYNMIASSNVSIYNYDNMGNQTITTGKLKNGYIGIKVGFCFGGGPL